MDKPLRQRTSERRNRLSEGRSRKTPFRVRATEYLASKLIAIGGLGTILAVLLVVVVLLANALPLLRRSSLVPNASISLPKQLNGLLKVGCDEHRMLYWLVDDKGSIHVLDASQGDLVESHHQHPSVPEDVRVTSVLASNNGSHLIFGFSNGTIRLANLKWVTAYAQRSSLNPEMARRLEDGTAREGNRILRQLPGNLIQSIHLESVRFEEPIAIGDRPVSSVDFIPPSDDGGLSKDSHSS